VFAVVLAVGVLGGVLELEARKLQPASTRGSRRELAATSRRGYDPEDRVRRAGMTIPFCHGHERFRDGTSACFVVPLSQRFRALCW